MSEEEIRRGRSVKQIIPTSEPIPSHPRVNIHTGGHKHILSGLMCGISVDLPRGMQIPTMAWEP